MSNHFKVYRVADAPQWMCDFGRLCEDDDPIVAVEKPSSEWMSGVAEHTMSHLTGLALAGCGGAYTVNETDTHIIYTVDRG